MKKIIILTGVTCCYFLSCQNKESQILGTWKGVQSPSKIQQIKTVYDANVEEINQMTTVSLELAEQYGTNNLDTLKQKMIEELKQNYFFQDAFVYQFNSKGELISINEKNGFEMPLFHFEENDDDLILSALDSKDEDQTTETVFEEGGILNISKVDKDSLILTREAGSFVDTLFFVKRNKK